MGSVTNTLDKASDPEEPHTANLDVLQEIALSQVHRENPEALESENKEPRPDFISIQAGQLYIGFWRVVWEVGESLPFIPHSEISDWLDENGYTARYERDYARRVFDALITELRSIRVEQRRQQRLTG